MVPAAVVDASINDLLPLLEPDDILIDGGNSYYVDDIRRAKELAAKKHPLRGRGDERRRLGSRARLLHDDWRRTGDRRASRSALRVARTGHRRHPPHPGPQAGHRYRRAGLPPLRAERRRALRQDGAQRHRVRPHGGLRRGDGHPARRQRRQADARRRCRDDAASRPRALPVRHQPRRGGRSVAARERHRLVAAGPHGHRAAGGSVAVEVRRPRVRLRRGTLDDHGGDRRGGAGAGADGRAVRAFQLARRSGLPEPAALGDALSVRRTPRESRATKCER